MVINVDCMRVRGYDVKIYTGWGESYHWIPPSGDLHNLLYCTTAEFNHCFSILSKYFPAHNILASGGSYSWQLSVSRPFQDLNGGWKDSCFQKEDKIVFESREIVQLEDKSFTELFTSIAVRELDEFLNMLFKNVTRDRLSSSGGSFRNVFAVRGIKHLEYHAFRKVVSTVFKSEEALSSVEGTRVIQFLFQL